MSKSELSSRQLTLLIALYMIGPAILVLPSSIAGEASHDAWLSFVLAAAVGLVLCFGYIAIHRTYAGSLFFAHTAQQLGKPLSRLVAALLLFFACMHASLVLFNIGDFVVTQMMPETPPLAIFVMFLALILFVSRSGMKTAGRASELVVQLIVPVFLFLAISLIPQIDPIKYLPIMENGVKPIVRGALPIVGFPFLELVLFLPIIPAAFTNRQVKVAYLVGIAIFTVVLLIVILLCIGVLGGPLTSRNQFPSFVLAKKINIGHFLERMEVFVGMLWFLTSFFKFYLLFHVITLCFCELAGVGNRRAVWMPMAILIMTLTFIEVPNNLVLAEFNQKIVLWFDLPFGVVLPAVLYVSARWRKKPG